MQQSLFSIFPILLLLFTQSTTTLSSTLASNDKIDKAPQSVFERLSQEEVLSISIVTDVNQLIENKKDSKYQFAHISFNGAASDQLQWRVLLKARGKYRNKICDFPPVKIKFDHTVLGTEQLKSFKSLKLVTHCGNRAEAEELVQKEYLAYKLYNRITDKSLRVQLVRIDWMDSSGTYEIGEKWGFIIESTDEMAFRINGGIYDEFGVAPGDIEEANAAAHALFQYMIGNADWNILLNKNIKLVKSHINAAIWVVPYDFDFSGLVNASYARTTMGQHNIRERVYLGDQECEALNQAIELYRSKEKNLIQEIDQFKYLSRTSKKDLKQYIRLFYKSLEEPLKGPEYYAERKSAEASLNLKNSE